MVLQDEMLLVAAKGIGKANTLFFGEDDTSKVLVHSEIAVEHTGVCDRQRILEEDRFFLRQNAATHLG
jgi:hypothetical protein